MTFLEDKFDLARELDATTHKILVDDLYKMLQLLDRGRAMKPEDFKKFMEVSRDFWKIRCGLTNAIEQSGA